MSGLPLTLTAVGLAALVNAQSTGSAGVLVAQIGLANAPFTVAPTLTGLPNELKRIATFGGGAVDPATIHIAMRDDSADTYELFGFGLYLADGTLFATYSQPSRILGKATISQALLSFDIRLSAAIAGDIHFGDTAFLDPPATTERAGLVELATSAETLFGLDAQRAVTPAGLKTATDAVTAEAHTFATTKKTEAIAAASADATTKANAAQAAAIAAIDALIAGAPGALNTLKELADAMGDDPNFAATVTNALALKAPLASPALTGNPTAPTPDLSDAGTRIVNAFWVKSLLNGLVGSAPGTLDTLGEIAAAISNDPNFATTITNLIATRKAEAIADANGYTDTKKAEAIATAAGDATTKASAAQAAAIASAAGDATTKANAAQAAAIASAAGDATTKANAAQAAAIAAVLAMFTGAYQSLTVPGYQCLPGGLIFQWGEVSQTITSDGAFSAVDFPIPFPNTSLIVLPVARNPSSNINKDSLPTLVAHGASGFNVYANTTTPAASIDGFGWFAVGF